MEYWTGLIEPGIGIKTVSLLEMYTHLYTNFGQITDGYLEESQAGITGQYDFATRPIPQFLHMVQKSQQLHGNAIPPRPITSMKQWVSPTSTFSGQVNTPSTAESVKFGTPRPSHLQTCKRLSLQRSVAYERNADKESHKVLQITLKTSSVRWRASL